MQAAATSNLKPVSLELGGKSPFIVFDDVDVDKFAPLAFVGALFNKVDWIPYCLSFLVCSQSNKWVFFSLSISYQGEICVAGSRLFIQEGIYDKFVKKLVEMTKTWVVGDPFDPNTRQGPQVYIRNLCLTCCCYHLLCFPSVRWHTVYHRFADWQNTVWKGTFIHWTWKEGRSNIVNWGQRIRYEGLFHRANHICWCHCKHSKTILSYLNAMIKHKPCYIMLTRLAGWHDNCKRRNIWTCFVSNEVQVSRSHY